MDCLNVFQVLVLLYKCEQSTKILHVCFGTAHTPQGEREGIGAICKRTVVLAPFVWLPYYTIILNIIILFLLSFGEEEGRDVRIFMKMLFLPQRGMACFFGETACLCLTPKISTNSGCSWAHSRLLWPGSSVPAGWLRLWVLSVCCEKWPSHGWCWGLPACPSCLLKKRGKICLCDFRWTVLKFWDVLLLKPINNKFMFFMSSFQMQKLSQNLLLWSNLL